MSFYWLPKRNLKSNSAQNLFLGLYAEVSILLILFCFLLISPMKCGFAAVTLGRDGQKDALFMQILCCSSLALLFCCFLCISLSAVLYYFFCFLTPRSLFIFPSISPISFLFSSLLLSIVMLIAAPLLFLFSLSLLFLFYSILSFPYAPQGIISILSSLCTLRLI